jgi:hypothetical protein
VAGRRRAGQHPPADRRALSWPLVAGVVAAVAVLGGGTAAAVHALAGDATPPPAGATSQPAIDPTTPPPSDVQPSATVPAQQPTAPGRTGGPAQPPAGSGPPPTDGVRYGGPIGLSIDGRDIDDDGTLDVWFISGHVRANTQAGVALDFDAGWTPATFRDECEARGPGDMSQQLSGLRAGAFICARTTDSSRAALNVSPTEGNTLWINVGSW